MLCYTFYVIISVISVTVFKFSFVLILCLNFGFIFLSPFCYRFPLIVFPENVTHGFLPQAEEMLYSNPGIIIQTLC
jgi:hypothetical protein